MNSLIFTPEQSATADKPLPKMVVSPLTLATDVPEDCGVYVFYIPGMTSYDDLVKELENYGKEAGKNIFVGIWSLGATPYSQMLKDFNIRKSPAVVISAKPEWSTDGKTPTKTAFATISDPHLLNDAKKAGDIINETCNLFMEGKVKEALSSARKEGWKDSLVYYLRKLYSGLIDFLKQVPVKFDLKDGTITMGGSG